MTQSHKPKAKSQEPQTTDLPRLPPRPAEGHKGTFGTVLVVGGQAAAPRIMLGGPALAALGALRSGAGLAVLGVPAPLIGAALTVAPAATGLALPVDERGCLVPSGVAELLDAQLPKVDAVAVGPAFGVGTSQQRIMVRLVGVADRPLVIDADGLNALAQVEQLHRDFRAAAILTPHPGEYARLAKSLGIEADAVEAAGRPDAAEQLARRLGCVVVLKGPGTIVTDGLTTSTNTTGNVALATGGTGDVLTGVIAGLVAQYFRPAAAAGGLRLLDCARLGVYIHGLAADLWSARCGSAGMLATDLLDEIPAALARLRDR